MGVGVGGRSGVGGGVMWWGGVPGLGGGCRELMPWRDSWLHYFCRVH